MLPGLVLTVGLIAQNIAGLVPPAPRNSHAPRFVNIGDDIVESDTAKPVAPAGACAPTPPPPVVEREVVIVPMRVESATDAAPVAEPAVDDSAGLPFFPVAVVPFAARMRAHAHPLSHSRTRTAPVHASTVMLPPFATVLLPPASTPAHAPSAPPKAGR